MFQSDVSVMVYTSKNTILRMDWKGKEQLLKVLSTRKVSVLVLFTDGFLLRKACIYDTVVFVTLYPSGRL